MDSVAHSDDPTLEVVQIDGLVVLEIIKHCQENLPELVAGQLLGLDVGTTLEVTKSFPYPSKSLDEDDENGDSSPMGAEYQIVMMKCLREVNVDNNTVGWYNSTYMGSFINDATIESQYNYQAKINNKCVMIVHDPLKSSQGILSLKAYRLTLEFMELYKNSTFTKESLSKAGVNYDNIFEEIPIKIHNSLLAQALLAQFSQDSNIESDFERLNLSTKTLSSKRT
eukprot:TRINITY_DN6954_c0_g1_i2.p1 TRINITY_DN6954_c0_g1~~TRINITY_DN6954_c0_g1_i2.p1  ORF type:complete len:243 (+),score=53.79 TRINITY_DN6954_c0_g1_i2:55-729(+)